MRIPFYPAYRCAEDEASGPFMDQVSGHLGIDLIPFFSVRSALFHSLKAAGFNRMDEILVPPYLCWSVLSTLTRTMFPAMSPSERTKAVFVYHQFGFPQDLRAIDVRAKEEGWMVVNNCANALLSRVNGQPLMAWGDIGVGSLSKFFHCGAGGVLTSTQSNLFSALSEKIRAGSGREQRKADEVMDELINIQTQPDLQDRDWRIAEIFGVIPELTAFPSQARKALPVSREALATDIKRRNGLLNLVRSHFPEETPQEQTGEEVAPFAIPVQAKGKDVLATARRIEQDLNCEMPVLHFDFARNMLSPDYRKSFVIGCHEGWSEQLVDDVCKFIRKYSYEKVLS